MNRPSRTEDDLEHPGWNQSPPSLASDLTTRQDLNGIANARVHRDGVGGGPLDEKQLGGQIGIGNPDHVRPRPVPATGGWRLYLAEPPVAQKQGPGGEGHAPPPGGPKQSQSRAWGWIGWIASVVVMSTILNTAGSFTPAALFNLPASRTRGGVEISSSLPAAATVSVAPPPMDKRRLTRRGNTCGANPSTEDEYNTPLHVGALLIILTVSSLACAIPMLALRFPILRIPPSFLFAFRHFGTGVLLATAFVHLLPTAFISLGDPCLSSFWTADYPAMPGAIALAGIFFVSVIEMIFSPARQYAVVKSKGRKGGSEGERGVTREDVRVVGSDGKAVGGGGHGLGHGHGGGIGGGGMCGGHAAAAAIITRPAGGNATSDGNESDDQQTGGGVQHREAHAGGEESLDARLTPEQLHKKSILQCMLLEVGILFHSVFIGMALSVAVGGSFVVLLIAIAFHQTFEGLALGARIATINWPKNTWQPYLMVLAYGCTTPIGQAIGLATHTLYDPASEFGLILVGTMNAISSGLLVFASLIELLSEDFLSDHSWVILRGKKRVIACCLVFCGAISMSIVGAWA